MLVQRISALSLFTALGLGCAHGAMTFSVSFTAQAMADLSASEQAFFTDGVDFWDNVIDIHRDGVSRNWHLEVDTFSQAASGGSVLLGSAGPSGLILSNTVPGSGLGGSWPNQFILSSGGSAGFNVHPDAGALQASTIRHEIGHALGIGTLWEDNEIYNDGNGATGNRDSGGTPGQLTGAASLAAYQAEFDPGATFVPVELDGGAGTANGHWNEADSALYGDAGSAVFAISGPGAGLSMDDELMSGSISGASWLSNTTIASLYDIGFEVVPEPGTTGLAVFGGLLLLGSRRRRS